MKLTEKVKTEYDKKRRVRYENFLVKRRFILENLARIPILQKKRNALWIQVIEGTLPMNDCEVQTENIDAEIENILKEHGYTISDIEYSPLCKKCNDTGFTNGTVCTCLKQEILQSLYMQSNLSNTLENECFETFDSSLFSTQRGQFKKSPSENIIAAKEKSLRFVENFDNENQNLLFIGTAGTGKTFLSNCIAKALLDKGKSVVYLSAFNLIERLTDISFGKIDKKESEILYSSDLLIIDDLGCERNTEYAELQLFNIINERLNRKKSMLISTNLSIGEINEHYTERFASRLVGCFEGIRFYGEDIRIRLHLQKKKANH